MLTKEIYIQNIEVKSGFGKNNNPWKFWKITDENAETYTDWSSQYADKIGQKVIITYEEKQGAQKWDGTHFVNREIVAKASPQTIEKLRAGAGLSANKMPAPVIKEDMDNGMPYNQVELAMAIQRIELKQIETLEMVKEIHGQIINPL